MANELISSEAASLATAAGSSGLSGVFKPLIREIHLFDTWVAGTTHLDDPSVLNAVREEDRLTLRREENRFDENAILVLLEDGRKLGYIPEKDNVIFSRLMDAGKLLAARVSSIEVKGSFHRIRIGIFLVDF